MTRTRFAIICKLYVRRPFRCVGVRAFVRVTEELKGNRWIVYCDRNRHL